MTIKKDLYRIIAGILLSSTVLFGQTEIDSLENLLKKYNTPDTIRINLLNELSYKIYQIDFEKSRALAAEAGTLSELLDYKKGKAESLRLTGNYHWMKSDFSKALEYYHKGLQLFYKAADKRGIALSYINLGIISQLQGNFPKALEYYQMSLKINEETGNIRQMMSIYNNIGIIYHYGKNYEKAIEQYEKALELNEIIGDQGMIATAYTNIGIIYFDQKNYSKALETYQKALKIHFENENQHGAVYVYQGIASVYVKEGQFNQALELYNKSIKISREIGSAAREAWSYLGLGNMYLEQKKYEKAYHYSKQAYTVANEIGEAELIQRSSETLAKSAAALGYYPDAYEYHVVFKTLSDSLQNEESAKMLLRLEYEYEHEKEQEIIKAERERREAVHKEQLMRQRLALNILIAATLIILLTSAFIFYLYQIKKKTNIKLEKANEEIRVQQSELQAVNKNQQKLLKELNESNAAKDKFFSIIAHDIKNPLQAMLSGSRLLSQRIDQLDEKTIKEIAAGMRLKTENLFELLENLLQWARLQMGKVCIMPRKLNIFSLAEKWINVLKDNAVQKKITVRNNIGKSLHVYADSMMIESVIQNLLANAIKFTEKEGKIDLNAEMNDGAVQITIKDDGVGIAKERINRIFYLEENMTTRGTYDEKGTGLGLILCKEFIEKNNGKIWIESEQNKGTSVQFTLPVPKQGNDK